MTLKVEDASLGLYFHIPFCARLCPYCDFAVAVRRSPDFAGYADALIAEFDAREPEWAGKRVRTVYFGGGTPSLFDLNALERVLAHVRSRLALDQILEFTLEANPASIDSRRLETWKTLGVSRLSVGVQSFDDGALRALGRNHTRSEALRAVDACAKSGLAVSIDLIFAGPDYAIETLESDLKTLESLGVEHVSAYQLTVEANTVFGRRYRAGELPLPSADDAADAYDMLRARLGARGIVQYEVSSHARAGAEAVHNAGYWEGRAYLGLGTGAHSFTAGPKGLKRRANAKRLKAYLSAAGRAESTEGVSYESHLQELLLLGVRHRGGVDLQSLEEAFGDRVPDVWSGLRDRLKMVVDRGLLSCVAGRYSPTAKGFALADSVAEFLIDFDDLRFRGRPTSS